MKKKANKRNRVTTPVRRLLSFKTGGKLKTSCLVAAATRLGGNSGKNPTAGGFQGLAEHLSPDLSLDQSRDATRPDGGRGAEWAGPSGGTMGLKRLNTFRQLQGRPPAEQLPHSQNFQPFFYIIIIKFTLRRIAQQKIEQ